MLLFLLITKLLHISSNIVKLDFTKNYSQKDKMQQNMISYFSVVKRVISLALLIFSSFLNYLRKDCED
jgi:hypothetical protein